MSDENVKSDPVEVKKSPKQAKTMTTKPVPMIYVGPSLERGRLNQYTVFSGGLPVTLDDLKEKYPQLTDLIVPVSELAYTQKRIATPGTFEQVAFESIKNGGGVVG
ncbi:MULTISPECIES: hypothetical protein [unclassified Paenibacillus]|uniref:hypothetical protein n=1 Tax=unclassified Paenibacillus TaxID=185978 RepID=UPI0030F56320